MAVPAALGLHDVVDIAAGQVHALALRADGSVVLWGNDSDGQTVAPGGLSGVVGVGAGARYSLAVSGDGTIWAWGAAMPPK